MAKKPLPTSSAPFHNPFAGLGAKLPNAQDLPPGPSPDSHAAEPSPPPATTPTSPSRAVVRYERKGHGGKEMTRVERLGLGAEELTRWLKEAKQALGCGGVVEGEALLLQGDQRERLRAWLAGRGVQAT